MLRRQLSIISLLMTVIVGSAMINSNAYYDDEEGKQQQNDNSADQTGRKKPERGGRRNRPTRSSEEGTDEELDRINEQKKKLEAAKNKSRLDRYREQQARLKLQQDTIPDSLLHPRWKIQRTSPLNYGDLTQGTADLKRPENIKQEVEYNDTTDRYIIGTRLGKTWVTTPIMMDLEEYKDWSEKHLFSSYFRKKNSEIYSQNGKEKFDFTDMHFDLGPAEKIFGPGGIRVKTQGSAELKLGATMKSIDNPALPIRNRNTTTIDFDEKININVSGKIGDKMNLNLNYNTDATFDYDAQNMKLKFDGKEDEIIKLVEAGNVSFPSNSSLIQGASSLFGLRTDMQFGKLKLQTVVSQKKSSSSSVQSKGGVQMTPFELNIANYEENKHFFLAKYFLANYDQWMKSLPTPSTGITINRVEIWVTNKNGQTSNTRDIIAMPLLGEGNTSNDKALESRDAAILPHNGANDIFGNMQAARSNNTVNATLEAMEGGKDYEKIEKARLLTSSEYTINSAMGYVTLKSTLQSDQVVAIAYEYTAGGTIHQVGEFTGDVTDVAKPLIVKSLKNTSSTPQQYNWKLMMRNVYYLASTIQKEKFKFDIKYKSDSTGVFVNYIPEGQIKNTPLIKLLGADRLDNNNKAHPNGYFDFVDHYTVSNGRVFLPLAEPFGEGMYNALRKNGLSEEEANKYCYYELYDSTKTVAKQAAEKNRFILNGQYKGSSANEISLGAYNIPQGSVVVTAGGQTLQEGSDYSVDYSQGVVTILNQSIIDAGTNVNVSLESQSDFSMQRKTMLGMNWEYDFSKDFQLSGTFQHLSEQTLTSKVTMGSEPVNNTLVGLNVNWKKESQWLTNIIDKIPFLHVSQPSTIQFNAEYAKLFSSIAKGTQDNASYIDDFESASYGIDISSPTSWTIASPPRFLNGIDNNYSKKDLTSGYDRARLAWYYVDPIFTRRSSTLTPSHIKNDMEQLSNHYVREVYVSELYPNRDQSTYSGATNTLSILNMAYYPAERGPYNFNPSLTANGGLLNPKQSWGGMMRKLDTNDFEEANIEYVEFWMLDPFVYHKKDGTEAKHTGRLYFNLGEISEDILTDGKKFYESGMPITASEQTDSTQWGRIPKQNTITYAFATTAGARSKQDLGYNGLTDAEEGVWYSNFLQSIQVNDSTRREIASDPANDNYRYYRGREWDAREASILQRYKYINNPQGNSPDSETREESYDTSYKTTPDVEDINQDYTLNENEKYFEYYIDIDPAIIGNPENYCVDKRETKVPLRNGKSESVTWYLYRIPINSPRKKARGGISDFSSIRFMRMYMTGFEEETVLRFASLNLVRGDWRVYTQNILGATQGVHPAFTASSISIEENSDKKPVNYVLPPGISRVVDPSQPQLVENDEQSMRFDVEGMGYNDAVAVYKNTNYDMRQYSRLQMFVHANATEQNTTNLRDNDLCLFLRLGSDYNNNFYEYEIPLKLTAPDEYSMYSSADKAVVWPKENMLDIDLSKFTTLKKQRNKSDAPKAKFFSIYDPDNQNNRISIVGTPSLGEVRTMMIGIKNMSNETKSGEVWVNELRLLEPRSEGGWAAAANLNVQLSDFGTVTAMGKYISDGFGGIEQKVQERTTDKYGTYSITTNLDLGKFFPEKAKVTAPLYYSVTSERTSPKYNPLDTDMELDDALESTNSTHERDSIKSIAITSTVNKNFALSGVKFGISTKRHPMPYDPANFTLSYSNQSKHTKGQTTVYENETQWQGTLNYSWVPVYKALEPFKSIKSKSKNLDILKKFTLNWLPQSISFNNNLTRNYYELQERDLEDLGNSTSLPVTFNSQFLWNRDFSIRWDLTKNLHMNFQSATRAEVEEPYTPVNQDLYPERYEAWKDSVWNSIKHMGTPLDYNQNFTASYQLPLNQMPVFDWLTADGSYSATYQWARGAEEDGKVKYGNTINNNRSVNINTAFNLEKLYNHVPFLKEVNDKFSKRPAKKKATPKKTKEKDKKKDKDKDKNTEEPGGGTDKTEDAKKKALADADAKIKAKQQEKRNTFTREITIKADTSTVITHGKRTKRMIVSAKDASGKTIDVKYKKIDDNKIKIINKSDSTVKMKLSIVALEPLENLTWYKAAQAAARFAMMVRSATVTYRNQRSMVLPGFKTGIGDVFGQRTGSVMSPGLDFAFGLNGEDYINKAQRNGWLMNESDSITSPAATNFTEDVQVKVALEPARNLKIDLNMAHSMTKAKTIHYMYAGNPVTQSGTFTMTTISMKSALEGIGDANNGYHSASFERFCSSLAAYRNRVEAQYAGVRYPAGSEFAGKTFDPAIGAVNEYSADVMVPAFLNAYTGYSGLSIFPAITKMLPNWTMKYSGLGQLPWFRDHFKSVNINHSYKSVYAVGSYSSYSTYMQFMGDNIGFITTSQSENPVPNSMFNVSSVSINEAFSPLLGVDVTLPNNMTLKAEYKTTRVLTLSMTSVQLNETRSNDWVIGMGYKINDFQLFGGTRTLKAKGNKKKGDNDEDSMNSKTQVNNKSKGFAHSLNLRLDMSYRSQAAITRDIATVTSQATSGNSAFKLAFSADYSMSRLLTMSLYYDRQTNTPLLSSGSYPTVTQDFGLSMKFSLTR